MIVKNYLRTLLKVGGSIMVAVPHAFLRRKKIVSGVKVVVKDEGDYIIIKTINEETLTELREDEKQKYMTNEVARLKILSKTYRIKQTDQQNRGKVKWKNAKVRSA